MTARNKNDDLYFSSERWSYFYGGSGVACVVCQLKIFSFENIVIETWGGVTCKCMRLWNYTSLLSGHLVCMHLWWLRWGRGVFLLIYLFILSWDFFLLFQFFILGLGAGVWLLSVGVLSSVEGCCPSPLPDKRFLYLRESKVKTWGTLVIPKMLSPYKYNNFFSRSFVQPIPKGCTF